jgi:hypothetical protein
MPGYRLTDGTTETHLVPEPTPDDSGRRSTGECSQSNGKRKRLLNSTVEA